MSQESGARRSIVVISVSVDVGVALVLQKAPVVFIRALCPAIANTGAALMNKKSGVLRSIVVVSVVVVVGVVLVAKMAQAACITDL